MRKTNSKRIKTFVGSESNLEIEITNEGFAKPIELYDNILLEQLMEQARVNRPIINWHCWKRNIHINFYRSKNRKEYPI